MKATRSESCSENREQVQISDDPDRRHDSANVVPFRERPAHPAKRPKEDAAKAALDRRLQAALGQNLRVVFEHIASEPVPERFMQLLQQLEAKEKQR